MPTSQISSDPPVEKQTLSAATDRIVTPRPMTIAIVASHVADWKGDRTKARSRSAGRATVVAGSWKPADPAHRRDPITGTGTRGDARRHRGRAGDRGTDERRIGRGPAFQPGVT